MEGHVYPVGFIHSRATLRSLWERRSRRAAPGGCGVADDRGGPCNGSGSGRDRVIADGCAAAAESGGYTTPSALLAAGASHTPRSARRRPGSSTRAVAIHTRPDRQTRQIRNGGRSTTRRPHRCLVGEPADSATLRSWSSRHMPHAISGAECAAAGGSTPDRNSVPPYAVLVAPMASRYTLCSSRSSRPSRRLIWSSKKAPIPHGPRPSAVAAR